MLNQLVVKFQQIPKLLLGFIVLVLVLVGLYFNSPPTTVCDIQMEEVSKRLAKGFFSKDSRGGGFEQGIMNAFNNCLQSNSPGGCHDMFARFDYLEGIVKSVPTECGTHSSTGDILGFLEKGLRLFTMIAWGDQPPRDRYNKTSWLDTADLGLFCRLKRQHQRLYGRQAWDQFLNNFLPRLPGADSLSKKELWEKCLFSYPCKGLY